MACCEPLDSTWQVLQRHLGMSSYLTAQPALTEFHSFFMAIGTTIRTDSSPIVARAFGSINNRPTILSRQYQSLDAACAKKS